MGEDEFVAQHTAGIEPCECCGGRPFDCSAPSCRAAGKCGCMMGEVEDEDEDDSLLVTRQHTYI